MKLSEKAAIEAKATSDELERLTSIAIEAAQIGGEVLMKYFLNINTLKDKGREGDLVTNADIEAEERIVSYLRSKTKECGIYAEESGISGPESSFVWCIDPLDGTTNYTHGYPFFATSIGLTWQNHPLIGAINIPYLKELYWAYPGKGSFCNNKKISVSKSKKLKDSLLVTGFAYDRTTTIDNNYAEFCWMTHRTRGVRRGGAAATDLAYVAAGKLDGYWERGLSPWDIAAGIPIVELAGGVVQDYKDEQFDLKRGRILAANAFINNEMIAELKQVKPLDLTVFT